MELREESKLDLRPLSFVFNYLISFYTGCLSQEPNMVAAESVEFFSAKWVNSISIFFISKN